MQTDKVTTEFGTANRIKFESIFELARHLEATDSYAIRHKGGNTGNATFIGRSWAECQRVLRDGDPAAIKRVRDVLDKVDASFADRMTSRWEPNVAGAYPCVPDFLAGNPEAMRNRVVVPDDKAPVRIFINISVAASIGNEAAANRGAAAAALAMRLAEDRPVELWAYSDDNTERMKDVLVMFKVDVHNASMNEIAFTMATSEALRLYTFAISMGAAAPDIGYIGWTFSISPSNTNYMRSMYQLMDAGPRDIVLAGGGANDAHEMSTDPVGWVHRQVEKQRAIDESAA